MIKTDELLKKKIDYSIKKYMAFKFMYNGKNYDGLVYQKHTTNTIEQIILDAMKKACFIENVESSNYARCGRTDAGVSSTGNVFSLYVRTKKDPDQHFDYVKIINNLLPDDIMITGSQEVDDSFDSRFSCLYREYKYFFFAANMNIEKMRLACLKLQGVHNFKNFCKIDKSDLNYLQKNYERRIYEFKIEKHDNLLFPSNCNSKPNLHNSYFEMFYVTIRGSAFLWHQVRYMMGILFLIGKGLEDSDLIDRMFEVETVRSYNYELASDAPLVLSDCQFEGVTFDCKIENLAENYFSISKIYEQNLTQIAINTFFHRNVLNLMTPMIGREISGCVNDDPKEDLNANINDNQHENTIIEYIESKYRRKKKYTKLLNHKINRNKK